MSSNLVSKPDSDLAAMSKRLATLERALASVPQSSATIINNLSDQPPPSSASALPPDSAYADVRQKLQGLTTAVEALCGAGTATPPTVQPSPSVTWTSIPMTKIGGTDLRHAATLAFDIPAVIPSTAKELLVYGYFWNGNANNGPVRHLKIYTQEGSDTKYEKYLMSYAYPQSAINTNSDNMWFPMPTNRKIFLQVDSDHGANCTSHFHVIGYR